MERMKSLVSIAIAALISTACNLPTQSKGVRAKKSDISAEQKLEESKEIVENLRRDGLYLYSEELYQLTTPQMPFFGIPSVKFKMERLGVFCFDQTSYANQVEKLHISLEQRMFVLEDAIADLKANSGSKDEFVLTIIEAKNNETVEKIFVQGQSYNAVLEAMEDAVRIFKNGFQKYQVYMDDPRISYEDKDNKKGMPKDALIPDSTSCDFLIATKINEKTHALRIDKNDFIVGWDSEPEESPAAGNPAPSGN